MSCEGSWGSLPRYIDTETDDLVTVQRCSGCADLLVIDRFRRIDVAPGASDREILAAVIAARTQARR